MSRPVKLLVYLVVAVAAAALVTGVAYWTANMGVEETPPGLYENGKPVENPGAMLTIGEYEVDFPIYRHYYLINKSAFESYYGTALWDDDPDGDNAYTLLKSVEVELVNLFSWLEIAEENGVALTPEEEGEIDATLAEQKEEAGDGWQAKLDDMFFLSEEDYLTVTRWQKLSEKMQAEYADAARGDVEVSVSARADQEFLDTMITAKHILVMVDTEAEDLEQAKADALEKAQDILDGIYAAAEAAAPADAGGEDGEDSPAQAVDTALLAEAFDEAMHEYSEDTGLEANPDGYTFAEGEMVDVFYEGAMALAEYEISEPILSEAGNYTGYHIIMRLPLDTSKMAAFREEKVSAEVDSLTQEKLDEMKKLLPVEKSAYYANLTAHSIR